MNLSAHHQSSLYVAVMAAVIGATVNRGRATPEGTVHRAREFADAAVREIRMSSKRSRK